MDNPIISIVIVNYNVKDFLSQCIKSIENASNNLNIEIIVVDNNSNDGSIEYLKPLFPNVKYIKLNQNIGFGKANNIGIKESKGEFLLILNPDTILQADTLINMLEYMQAHKEVGIAGCKVLNSDGSFQLACRRGFPTPWTSFCKLFGLQKIFPKSKLFAKYNQTYKSIDESYYIDSVIGAFMFARKQAIDQVNGFDSDFFMYGEDIDLCFRVNKAGWKIGYNHSTSIIHYKGESTKRSSIDEVKHFYQAMEVYAKKHFSNSFLFLLFLRIGIIIRLFVARLEFVKRDVFLIVADLIIINSTLLFATSIKFDEFFGFPNYAYPTVFIVLSLILLISMTSVGEYFESQSSVRKSFYGYMISFFLLSSLTYFFKDYAFSRGVLLMTIGFSILFSSILRFLILINKKFFVKDKTRNILIVGLNKYSVSLIDSISKYDKKTVVAGIINTQDSNNNNFLTDLPILGSVDSLSMIIQHHNISELIITDSSISKQKLISFISNSIYKKVNILVANSYKELSTARIINDIAGKDTLLPISNLNLFRYKFAKRIIDILLALFFLTFGLVFVFIFFSNIKKVYTKLWYVLIGKYSFIGLYPMNESAISIGKPGILGLAQIGESKELTREAIISLNDFYIQNFNLSLDIDIFLKFLLRKKSGN